MTDNPKYLQITAAGKELVWKYGIKRVTVEEICKKAGVSKMTFYKFFPNKIELVKTLLDQVNENSMNTFRTISHEEIPFSDKLKKIFLMKLEAMKGISMELLHDLQVHPNPEIEKYMLEKRNSQMHEIVNFYKNAQKEGYIRADVKINFIIKLSVLSMKLMEDNDLLSEYSQPQDFVLEVMNTLFYGITTRDEKD